MTRVPSDLPAIASMRTTARPVPKPPRWALDPCRNPHCRWHGTIHDTYYHETPRGERFDRPA
jgi:hypothetical protein